MVNAPTLIIIGIAAVAFLAFDGVRKTGEFIESIRKGSVPILSPKKTELADSSATEIRTEPKSQGELEISSVTSRSGKQTAKPTSIFTTQAPKAITVLSAQQSGAIAGKSNISTGQQISLSSKEISDLRKTPLTAQEQADVAALQARKSSKSVEQQKRKTDPLELVLQKREQELISKKVLGQDKFVGGKLFANPDFPLSNAEKKARGLI